MFQAQALMLSAPMFSWLFLSVYLSIQLFTYLLEFSFARDCSTGVGFWVLVLAFEEHKKFNLRRTLAQGLHVIPILLKSHFEDFNASQVLNFSSSGACYLPFVFDI